MLTKTATPSRIDAVHSGRMAVMTTRSAYAAPFPFPERPAYAPVLDTRPIPQPIPSPVPDPIASDSVRELTSLADLAGRTVGDPHLDWAAGTFGDGVRAWAAGDAVAVARTGLWRQNLIAIRGAGDEAELVARHALDAVGAGYHLLGDKDLLIELAERIDDLAIEQEFQWLDTTEPTAVTPAGWSTNAQWLGTDSIAEADRLLSGQLPTPRVRPGADGVRRWAGTWNETGHLTAVAAEAWSSPTVGFVSGLAVTWNVTDSGDSVAAAGLVIDTLVAKHGRAALLLDAWDIAAIRRYEGLGLHSRPMATAISAG